MSDYIDELQSVLVADSPVGKAVTQMRAEITRLRDQLRWRRYGEERSKNTRCGILVRHGGSGNPVVLESTTCLHPDDLWMPIPSVERKDGQA